MKKSTSAGGIETLTKDPLALIFAKLNIDDFLSMRATSRAFRAQADAYLTTLNGMKWLFYHLHSSNAKSLLDLMSNRGVLEDLRNGDPGIIGYLLNQLHKKETVDAKIVLKGLASLNRPQARSILEFINVNAGVLLKSIKEGTVMTNDDHLLNIFLHRSEPHASMRNTLREYVQQSDEYSNLQTSFDAYYWAAQNNSEEFVSAINAKPIIITLFNFPEIGVNSSLDLSYANLSEISFEGRSLPLLKLIFADLHTANLQNADMSKTNLSHANLSAADCEGTNFCGAQLDYTKLNHVEFDAKTQFDNAVSKANLKNLIYMRGYGNWNPALQARDSLSNLLALLRLRLQVTVHGQDMFTVETFGTKLV